MKPTAHNIFLHRTFQYVGIILFVAIAGGYWYWKNAQAAQTVTDNRPSFDAPLTTSLDLAAGQGIATYSRADGADRRATVTDFEGLIRPVKAGEARFEGARRVENLLLKSETYDGTSWPTQSVLNITTGIDDPFGGASAVRMASTGANGYMDSATTSSEEGRTYRFTIWVRNPGVDPSSTLRVILLADGAIISASNYVTNTVPSTWTRYSIIGTAPATTTTIAVRMWGGSYFASGETLDLAFPILEEVTGQTNQNPSEYVSVGVKASFPYHGAGVDGVRYFDTENGNTVTNNVVTEAAGAKIASSTLKGYLSEGGRTNMLTYSEQLDSWISDDGSVSADVTVAPDGRSTADKFVSNTNAAQHRVKQAVTLTAGATYTGTAYVKKAGYDYHMKIWSVSGNATVSVDLDTGDVLNTGGGEYVNSSVVSLPSGWYRVSLTMTTVNGGAYTQMNYLYDNAESFTGDGTSGVYLWGVQIEQAAFASSYIPTTTTAVARAGDNLSYPMSNIPAPGLPLTMAVDAVLAETATGTTTQNLIVISGEVNRILRASASFSNKSMAYHGTSAISSSTPMQAQTAYRFAYRVDGTNLSMYRNGVGVSRSQESVTGSGTAILIGGSGGTLSGAVKNVRIWKKALSDTELQNMTSTTEGVATSAIKKTSMKAIDNAGLVGYWSFDDGSGTKAEDFSPTGTSTGTLTNGPTWVDGKIGKALSFASASNQYLSIDGASQLKNSVFTYSAWINPINLGTMTIFGGGVADTPRFRITAGSPALVDTGVVVLGTASSPVVANRWTHVAVTYDSNGSYVFYVDGVKNGSGTDLRTFDFSSANFEIGKNSQGSNEYFNGQIDDVRVYDRPLSQDEISAIYEYGGVGKTVINASQNTQLTDGLVGLWSFNGPDLSGTTAYDRSGQGNNGTLTNGPTVYPGKVGQALSFDGTNDYIGIADSASLDAIESSNRITLTAWIYPESDQGPSSPNFRTIATRGIYGAAGNSWMLAWDHVNDELELVIRANSTRITRTASMEREAWNFVVAVYDGSDLALYRNGAQIETSQVEATGLGAATDLPMYIGSDESGSDRYFRGLIDEVRIYNRALSASEVSALYNAGR